MQLLSGMILIVVIVGMLSGINKLTETVVKEYKKYPVFEYVVDFFTPDFTWKEPEKTPEYEAIQLSVSLAGKVVRSWGANEIDGYPIKYGGIYSLDRERSKSGVKTTKRILMKEVGEKSLPVYAVKLGFIYPDKYDENKVSIGFDVYTMHEGEKIDSNNQKLNRFEVKYFYQKHHNKLWKLERIEALTTGYQIKFLPELFGNSRKEIETNVERIYISKNALANKVSASFFQYENPRPFLDYVYFNSSHL